MQPNNIIKTINIFFALMVILAAQMTNTYSLALLSVTIIVPTIIMCLGIEGQARALRPVFIIFIAYEIARRYALSWQRNDKVI